MVNYEIVAPITKEETIRLAREGFRLATQAYSGALAEGDEVSIDIFYTQREVCWAALDELLV